MHKPKILIIGMLDSIHLARWVQQFVDKEVQIAVFPSSHFKRIHGNFLELNISNVNLIGITRLKRFAGYFDSLLTFRFFGNKFGEYTRRLYLKLFIFFYRPTIIHAIEIQHAGYLVSSIKYPAHKKILTNWGSDIYYFQHLPEHETRIRLALKWATHYSAECTRDYELARKYGYSGVELPKIPNAGGLTANNQDHHEVRDRSQLIVKCYGGRFGLGSMAMNICDVFMAKNANVNVFLYSVTKDLLGSAKLLASNHPGRVRFSTLKNPLSHDSLLLEFRKSRVYLGMSRSDGLSTSFLEALISGSYPIQTNTSCANEIIEIGAIGSIVKPEISEVTNILNLIFWDENFLISAIETNQSIAKKFLDISRIKSIANSYYE